MEGAQWAGWAKGREDTERVLTCVDGGSHVEGDGERGAQEGHGTSSAHACVRGSLPF